MANPQKENGYTKIANEIMEALMKINLGSYQSRLLWAIFRKTYGFNKREDWLSNSQLVKLTGLRKQHISRTKKELIERKMVTWSGNKIRFNKDYSQWCELPKSVTIKKVTNLGNGVTDLGVKVTCTGEHKRNITKETYTKEIFTNVNTGKPEKKPQKVEYGNKEINDLLKAIKMKVGIEKFADTQKWQRIYGKHCLSLMVKITSVEFSRRLDILLEDSFKRKRMNELKYIYEQVGAFIEPQPIGRIIS